MININKLVLMSLLVAGTTFFINSETSAQQNGKYSNQLSRGFIDLNGDGINDRALDADKDGIPNCIDSDYVRPKDGTGYKSGLTSKVNLRTRNGGFGPGNGTGNSGVGPKDGTGYGPGSGTGTGVCDGTGPKGNRRNR